MKNIIVIILLASLLILGCGSPTEDENKEIINVTTPNSTTGWIEYQIGTSCEWNNAEGDSVYIEIYKGDTIEGLYKDWTPNDGYYGRAFALDDLGSGTDFRLKVIDKNDNFGWSEYFTIGAAAGQIDVTFPVSTTTWVEFQIGTYCEWADAAGDSVYIEIYQGSTNKGLYKDWTPNDGYYGRDFALSDFGTGADFRLKVTDEYDYFGWSDYFTIEAVIPDQIFIIFPESTTSWLEYQTNTYCDWSNSTGDSLYIEIYKGSILMGSYHGWTGNDGHCSRAEALNDWGNGSDFQLKLIDSDGRIGLSDFFEIEPSTPGPNVYFPESSTVWQEFETNTFCDWTNFPGDSVYVEIYQGTSLKGFYHNWTNNDGHCSRNVALGDWGNGTDFRLKVIDSDYNFAWSEYFTIEAVAPGPIIVIYPESTTVWDEFEQDTSCDWSNATGATVYIEIYKGDTYKGIYHEETNNDGHCTRNGPLGNWGTGSDFKLKVIDSDSNEGWSANFTIE